MAKIKINEEALRANSIALSKKIEELQNLNSRLESLIAAIGDSWDGKASEAYVAQMLGYATKAKEMTAVLTEYKKYVDSAVNKFSAVDAKSASRIRNSF